MHTTLDIDKTGLSLAELKQVRYGEIDRKTGGLIQSGFTFDSKVFSASPPAQFNWNSIKGNKPEFTFPLEISTLDNDTYNLTDVNVSTFWASGRDHVKGHLDSGRALKKSIKDAVDIAAVNAIVDAR